MKNLITILLLMTSLSPMAQNGKAITEKKTFSRTTTVSIAIESDVSILWALLTNAADFPRWNSTITSIDGDIEQGKKIRLKSTLDTKRTFKLKVKEMVPDQKMVWKGGMGKRVYTLKKSGDQVIFTMSEKIGGLMFPLFANKIPSFDESFEQFAADLKKEAELIAQAR